MKIAITGHTAGIGQALAEALSEHEIVGLSKRHGHNIHATSKIANLIEPCDVFINNAQSGYAQTELLFEMAKRWEGTNKHIIVISTVMTQNPSSDFQNLDMDHYRVQKVALEEAVRQIRNKTSINISIVRPGDTATSPDKTVPPSADPRAWAQTLVAILTLAESNNLIIPDISLEPK